MLTIKPQQNIMENLQLLIFNSKSMKKWEYLERKNPKDEEFNRLGNEGWELVAIQYDEYFIFKRELIEEINNANK